MIDSLLSEILPIDGLWMDNALVLSGAFFLGLLSSLHCVGMCGGIMGALTLAIPAQEQPKRLRLLLAYNLGRILSYSFMGLVVGFFAEYLAAWGAANALRILAALLLVAMGLYLANWWRGLIYLERLGRYLWAFLQPVGKQLLPVTRSSQALALGAVWGWLPCGLVYTALVYAMAQAHALMAAGTMLAFGLGTLPAVLATGLAAQALVGFIQRPLVRRGFALIIIGCGVWTLLGALGMGLGSMQGHHHDHSGANLHHQLDSKDDPSQHQHHH